MTIPRRIVLFASLALPVAGRAEPSVITGTVAYRERIALPPGVVLEVALLDIARADAPADRIAEARIPVTGQVPIPFTLPYDPARIVPQGRYSVEARLVLDGRLLFRSDRINPVLSQGAGRQVEIRLARVGGGATQGLAGSDWVVEDIAGRGVVDRLRTSMAFAAQGRVSGSGGCNRFTGGYQQDGPALRFGQMASTQMACVPAAMDQERRFFEALAAVIGWRIENGLLHLTGAGDATLIRLSRAG
jgi:putative lipoprotein